MPKHVDILLERLKGYDELTLLELLDISSEELVHRFKDVIIRKREYLFGEIEAIPGEELDFDSDEWDEELEGFQIEYVEDRD